MHMFVMKNTANNTISIVRELHTFCNYSMGLHLKFHYEAFFPSIFSLHSSNKLSTNLFLHLRFL